MSEYVNVLVVDDNTVICDYLVEISEDMEHGVAAVSIC